VAAAFNTPLAGILFAIEELAHAFAERTTGASVIAVVLGGMVTLALAGNYTYFGVSQAALPWGRGWLAVALCGLAGGLLGALFARLLTESARLFRPLGALPVRHPVLFAALIGLLLALLGALSGGATFGTGYEQARRLIEGRADLPWSFAPLKLLATALSYWSGIPGGIFAPSLAVGAGVGRWIASLFPGIPPGPVILLGMAAYFAGVVQAPLTAAVIVMEMTANPGMRLPLLAAAFLGFAVARLLNPSPLYRALATRFLEAFTGAGADAAPRP
jgi:H+/Cl- antiporter ClcA